MEKNGLKNSCIYIRRCEINPSLWEELINDDFSGKEYSLKNRTISQSCPDSEKNKTIISHGIIKCI